MAIPDGALFYGKTRRRADVRFDELLRQKTQAAALQVHRLIESGKTPEPVYTPKCESCSLISLCLPKTAGRRQAVKRYLDKVMQGE